VIGLDAILPSMPILVGTPSDDVPEILATGRPKVTALYLSMSARHPEGRDADYLQWHTLDHRPEQYRLPSVRSSLRIVSTPACRAARATNAIPYRDVDHVMTYFFSDSNGRDDFVALSTALRGAGRTPYTLPMVERGAYAITQAQVAPAMKIGADVLPWWPARGVYVLIERGEAPAAELLEVPGIAGMWTATGSKADPPYSEVDNSGVQLVYCLLDQEPVDTAERLREVLDQRWKTKGIEPLLAAPFHPVVPWEWDHYLP
jgi:hypothetical protein